MKDIVFWVMVPIMSVVWGITLLVSRKAASDIEEWIYKYFDEQTRD